MIRSADEAAIRMLAVWGQRKAFKLVRASLWSCADWGEWTYPPHPGDRVQHGYWLAVLVELMNTTGSRR